jgi:phosphatidylglycerophosphate synthase
VLDATLRRATGPLLERGGARLAAAGVRPLWLTGAGWILGVGACVAAGVGCFAAALGLWLANRALDGLDGPVARAGTPSDLGGYLDILADFSIYGGFVLGVAVALPAARLACVALLAAYATSATAFLALSSLLERRRAQAVSDERSLRFAGGLAEGSETIVVYVLLCLLPAHAALIAGVFAAAVALTALQRAVLGARLLGARQPGRSPGARPAEATRPARAGGALQRDVPAGTEPAQRGTDKEVPPATLRPGEGAGGWS